tara:strand:- start:109 stop:1113 length:1005 start_codon:yes stop_codon:yes gene_type:complete
MKTIKLIASILILASSVNAKTLDEVKNRGFLICGISENLIGFSNVNDKGEWNGFDIDMCRAVSAAVFGDLNKVEFVSTTPRSRFPMLASGEIDLLVRNTTWTFSRDTNLGFEFVGVNFYDGQGLMVRKSLDISNINDLDGSTICLISGSAKEYNLNQFFLNKKINFIPLALEIEDDALENYLSKRCDVYTNFLTELAITKTQIPNSSQHVILDNIFSKEPLGPLVRHGDNEWADIVRWSLFVMILAEELNINAENIDSYVDSNNKEILRILGEIGNYGDMIELDYKWAYNIIKQVGNYSTVFERNIGINTALGLKRGLNALWSDGGILYAPPFR